MADRALALALILLASSACGDDVAGTGGGGATSASSTAATSQATSSSSTSTGAGGAGDGGGGGGDASSLSMLAWNLQSYPKTGRAPDVVETVIRDLRPAIAAFVEVEDLEGLEAAIDASGDYELAVANDPPYATVVAVDARVGSIISAGPLFTDQTYLFPRAPTAARIELAATGEQLDVLALHLKAQIDEESEERRRQANDQLAQWCASRHEQLGTPIALLGDFNDELVGPEADDVFGAYRESTAPPFRLLTLASEQSGEYTYVPFRAFIDHAIATEPLATRWPTISVRVIALDEEVADYVRDVSDHRPVLVELAAPSGQAP